MSTDNVLRDALECLSRTRQWEQPVYVDRQGKVITDDEHSLLTQSFEYCRVKMESVGNGVNIYTRWDGLVGNRSWLDEHLVISKPYVIFRINADDTGDFLGGYDSEEEALRAHRTYADNERTFQTILRGTVPAVREGAL